jgi:hypothetical protein
MDTESKREEEVTKETNDALPAVVTDFESNQDGGATVWQPKWEERDEQLKQGKKKASCVPYGDELEVERDVREAFKYQRKRCWYKQSIVYFDTFLLLFW